MSLSGCFLLQLYAEFAEIKNFYPHDFVDDESLDDLKISISINLNLSFSEISSYLCRS
jgi:hypothetical protein